MCVCVLPRNLRDSFVSLLVEPIAGKNVSPSDKQLWRFPKNVLVAEKLKLNYDRFKAEFLSMLRCMCSK